MSKLKFFLVIVFFLFSPAVFGYDDLEEEIVSKIEILEKAIGEENLQLDSLHKEYLKLCQEKEALSQQLQAKEQAIKDLTEKVAQSSQGCVSQTVSKCESEKQNLTKELSAKEEKILVLQKQLETKAPPQESELPAQIEQKNAEIKSLKNQLKQKTEPLKDTVDNGSLDAWEREKAELVVQLQQKDKEIELLKSNPAGQEIANLPPKESELGKVVAAYEAKIEMLKKDIKEGESVYKDIIGKLRLKDDEINQVKQDCLQKFLTKDEEIKKLKDIIKSTIDRIELLSSSQSPNGEK